MIIHNTCAPSLSWDAAGLSFPGLLYIATIATKRGWRKIVPTGLRDPIKDLPSPPFLDKEGTPNFWTYTWDCNNVYTEEKVQPHGVQVAVKQECRSGSEVVLDGSLGEGSREDAPQSCNGGLRPCHGGDDGNFEAKGVPAQILAIPHVRFVTWPQPRPLPFHFHPLLPLPTLCALAQRAHRLGVIVSQEFLDRPGLDSYHGTAFARFRKQQRCTQPQSHSMTVRAGVSTADGAS